MAAAARDDRAEVDTARPFRSVKQAVAVFSDRIIVGSTNSHSRHSSGASASASAIATLNVANACATSVAATAPAGAKHEASSSSSSTMTFGATPMAAESEAEIMPAATVPMYSAPSSPASLASSPSPAKPKPCSGRGGDGDGRGDEAAPAGGLAIARSIQKLEADVSETRQEVSRLRKRGTEMEAALANLRAQLHRGLSKLAEMEADRAAAGVGGDTDDVASSLTLRSGRRWGDRLAASECLPSFSHALSLGEMDDGVGLVGCRRRKACKVKPVVPLIGDILFSRRRSTKEKGDDGFYSAW